MQAARCPHSRLQVFAAAAAFGNRMLLLVGAAAFLRCRLGLVYDLQQARVVVGPKLVRAVDRENPGTWVPAQGAVEHLAQEPVVEVVRAELQGAEAAGLTKPRPHASLLVQRNRIVFRHGDVPALQVALQDGREFGQTRCLPGEAEAQRDLRFAHASGEHAHPPEAVPRHVDLRRGEEAHEGGAVRESWQRKVLPLKVVRQGHDRTLCGHAHRVPVADVRRHRRRLHWPKGGLVDGGSVVRFASVLHEKLPIAFDIVLSPGHTNHVAGGSVLAEPLRQMLRQISERLAERRRFFRSTGENEAMEGLHANRP
mmetsp:Transcript_8677/g.22443  ORF Transcript_8677/g.22443 Transcript_8677/m.22443 type:complete len:311 (-) Transcript_8677:652-1584(-)